MELSDQKKITYQIRILQSRTRILVKNGFFGQLLMHTNFGIDPKLETACTDGDNIIFGTDFLDSLTDNEIDFIMCHEILHMCLNHCTRNIGFNQEIFNIAADIVVNSNILESNNYDISSITLSKYGVSMHKTPNGNEGCEYTAEEVYSMLIGQSNYNASQSGFDNHTLWKIGNSNDSSDKIWEMRILQAAHSQALISDKTSIKLPGFAERLLSDCYRPKLDWKTLLTSFVQEELFDYSYSPPDRRFSDTDFFIPDYNETKATIRNVLFMVDTSSSVSKQELSEAVSELIGAMEQFDGSLQGWLGYFDACIYEPEPISSVNDIKKIKPKGGGGTSFAEVFRYINKRFNNNELSCIIILTDGYDCFPPQSVANNVPVLWIISKGSGINPPWGMVCHMY